jgi:hypothetical protein
MDENVHQKLHTIILVYEIRFIIKLIVYLRTLLRHREKQKLNMFFPLHNQFK